MSRTILIVAPYLPLPSNFGGAIRIFHLVKALATSNSIVLLAPVNGDVVDEIVQLGQFCDVTTVPVPATVREPASRRKRVAQLGSLISQQPHIVRSTWSMKFQAAMDRLFQTRSFDLVQYEFPQMAIFRPSIAVPTLVDAHNIEYMLLQRIVIGSQSRKRSFFNAVEFARVRQFERFIWRQSTVNIATSAHDAAIVKDATGQEAPIVPNGVSFNTFAKHADFSPTSTNNILFTGAMRHGPNADGASWFANEVLPIIQQSLPGVSFTIAGADPPASVISLASRNVEVTGTVKDIGEYIERASVSVVPLHSGSGTRLKILEAFAARRPVVSTSIGAEGLDVLDGKHLLIANSARDFASAVIRVLKNPALADSISSAGQRLARDSYTWASIVPLLKDAQTMAIERFHAEQEQIRKTGIS